MLALIYLALAIYIGDFLCRRFYRFVSIGYGSAAAVITGLLISSLFSYLSGLLFARAKQPLFGVMRCSLWQQPPCYFGPYGKGRLESPPRLMGIVPVGRTYTSFVLRVQAWLTGC
jgi:hypothetical protein